MLDALWAALGWIQKIGAFVKCIHAKKLSAGFIQSWVYVTVFHMVDFISSIVLVVLFKIRSTCVQHLFSFNLKKNPLT